MPSAIVAAIGWLAATMSAIMPLPQAARIARTRSAAGVSQLMWQGGMASAFAWLAYGITIGTHQIIWPNLIWGLTSTWIVWRVAGMRHRPLARDLAVPLLAASAIYGTYFLLGAFGFGIVVALPTLAGLFAQLVTAARATDLSGISAPMLVINTACVATWLSFGSLIGDGAIIGADTPILLVTAANLVLLLTRRVRLAQRTSTSLPATPPEASRP